jgi:multidrug efflux pump subunit AcrB
MSFIAIVILGVLAMNYIPVSLMPNIDIPEITVQVSGPNTAARELENTVVKPIRRQLMQLSHLADITSETRNENGLIHLRFEYGANIDYAFIEVNEKIDRAMNSLPRSIARPRVIKANASDIPVFYLNLTLKSAKAEVQGSSPTSTLQTNLKEFFPVSQAFAELSRFSTNVISKRIEQLPEVAMVDVSGTISSELLVLPNNMKLRALGLTLTDMENGIISSNVRLGNLLIRDGQYQYNIRFSSTLQNKKDLEDIYFKVNNRLFQLKDVATVIEHPQKQKGMVVHNGSDAVVFAVIKQSDARMSDLKNKLNALIGEFEKDYPDIRFDITRNQTTLLDYSIGNLGQDLFWGAILAFVVMFFFLKDFRAPLLVGITIPTSLVVSMLFFYLLGISINVVSLSGIILGVGMTVDNSIIVIDNITQHRERLRRSSKAESLLPDPTSNSLIPSELNESSENAVMESACVSGVNEVFGPLLSSSLTNSAVFLPLIFISGIAGAMFYDQAMAVTIGLLVSLGVSATLLPVYYRLIYKRVKGKSKLEFLKKINLLNFEVLYMKGFRFAMRNQALSFIIVGLLLTGSFIMYPMLEKTRLPAIERDELMFSIDWNEHIHVGENKQRVMQMVNHFSPKLEQNTCMIGEQQFLVDKNSVSSPSEAIIYMKVKSPSMLDSISTAIELYLETNFPHSIVHQREVDNIFNMIFSSEEKPFTVRLRAAKDYGPNYISNLQKTLSGIQIALPDYQIDEVPLSEYTVLHTDPARLALYGVSFNRVYGQLKTVFNQNQVMVISDNQDFVPVVLGNHTEDIREIINGLHVRNEKNELIPVRDLVHEAKGEDLKVIVAGKEGEYFPVNFTIKDDQAEEFSEKIASAVNHERLFEAGFGGSIYSNRALTKELAVILLIAFALLYFILTSEFESLTLPMLVLLEIPIDIFGAFIALKLGGTGINLMSLIGIVVMSGIVINDSILKVETMNRLYREGVPLMRAIVESGHRRLLSIMMTTLTAILSLLPILFTGGLGADLQKPLALAVIGSMILGTAISLYFVPLCFYYMKRSDSKLRKLKQS